jgi:hypothetical protein
VTVNAIEAPRSITLSDLRDMLVKEHAEKLDLVIPATKIRAKGGRLIVTGADLVLTEGGFLDPNGAYDVADTCDDGISAKLDIPRAFLRKMHTERPDVWDLLVTRLLQGATVRTAGEETVYPADSRTFLLRTFVSLDTDAAPGRRVARALLSDRYEIIDNLDYLTAVLTGVRESGVDVEIDADITDRRMYVRLVAPGVSVDASPSPTAAPTARATSPASTPASSSRTPRSAPAATPSPPGCSSPSAATASPSPPTSSAASTSAAASPRAASSTPTTPSAPS